MRRGFLRKQMIAVMIAAVGMSVLVKAERSGKAHQLAWGLR